MKLKPIAEQVIVITGASSGIGRVTAREAAKRGARLVLVARGEDSLKEVVDELRVAGGEAVFVTADVADEEDMRRVSRTAVERFGGFDTWVNNAGITTYGRILEVSLADHRRLFETNFWGVVIGSRIAAEHLRDRGGAIINVGSTFSDLAFPLQGMYSASKHAVKGFTDALRMELEAERARVSVSLIKPSAIDTPYSRHAKNYLPNEPRNPPPRYAPEPVAESILHCAEHPRRDLFVGAAGRAMATLAHFAPRLTDRVLERTAFKSQQSGRPARFGAPSSLYEPSPDGDARGDRSGLTFEHSLYTTASMHPVLTFAAVLGAGVAVAGLLGSSRR